MQAISSKWRAEGRRIAFVPTMGALHEGHLELLRKAKKIGDKLALSIYVNPKQFGPKEDFARYPRDLSGDLSKVSPIGVDAVFFPSDWQMYPKGHQTFVEVTDATKGLCGASRPAHFRGVTTIVLKLFNIVRPDVAVFGEKDYQQLVTIRTMVRDLNVPVEIIGVETVRENNGLAMSSRNAYLSPSERISAVSINKALMFAKQIASKNEGSSLKIIDSVERMLSGSGLKIDYVKICDPETLKDTPTTAPRSRLLIAAFAGKTRLIDNCELYVLVSTPSDKQSILTPI